MSRRQSPRRSRRTHPCTGTRHRPNLARTSFSAPATRTSSELLGCSMSTLASPANAKAPGGGL
eukprot:8262363-Lingulodinium_polyedra.AAC.1